MISILPQNIELCGLGGPQFFVGCTIISLITEDCMHKFVLPWSTNSEKRRCDG